MDQMIAWVTRFASGNQNKLGKTSNRKGYIEKIMVTEDGE